MSNNETENTEDSVKEEDLFEDANDPVTDYKMENLDDQGEDEMNATMMAIDLTRADLDAATKVNIKVDEPTDEEIIQEQLEQKKFFLFRWYRQARKKAERVFSQLNFGKRPAWFSKFEGSWLPSPGLSKVEMLMFFLLRVLVIALSAYLHKVLYAQASLMLGGDFAGSQSVYLGLLGAESILLLLAIVLRWSPFFLMALPVAMVFLFFSWLSFFYHPADGAIYALNGEPINTYLNQIIFAFVAGFGVLVVLGVVNQWRAFCRSCFVARRFSACA
ncbi:MAG: hypothetical protein H7A33_07570 [Deltaproteobacteria bacterium]|nr:hypothetical protein [Deltaproteobacteria bacterium]